MSRIFPTPSATAPLEAEGFSREAIMHKHWEIRRSLRIGSRKQYKKERDDARSHKFNGRDTSWA